jgi:AsmA protein
MKKKIILGLIILSILTFLVLGALVAAPVFIDPQKYRPMVENSISKAVGHSVSLGENLHLSLFPRAGVHFDGLKVANAPGFEQEYLLTLKSLEVRAGLLPLLSGELRIKRFVMVEPRLFLEHKDGHGNWEYLGGNSSPSAPAGAGEQPPASSGQDNPTDRPWSGLALHGLEIKDGAVSWQDHDQALTMIADEINVMVQGAAGAPLNLELSARINQKPLTVNSRIGPFHSQGADTTLPLDFSLKILDNSEIKAAGRVGLTGAGSQTDLTVDIPPFSLRKLWTALQPEAPIPTRDPQALEKVGFKAHIRSNGPTWELAEGRLELDDTIMDFSARLTPGPQPRLDFDLNLDTIDLDRYREAETADRQAAPYQAEVATVETPPGEPEAQRDQYKPYRNLAVQGRLRAARIKAAGVTLDDPKMDISGAEGRFNFDPFDFTLYGGPVATKIQLDLREPKPFSRLDFRGHDIQVGPIFRVLRETAFMEGTMATEFELTARGDTSEEMVPSLNGSGKVTVLNGSFETGYLPEVVLKLMTTTGIGTQTGQKARFPFSRHEIPFTIKDGVINTPRVYLQSPQMIVIANGRTDLVRQTLNFEVDNQIAGGPRVPMTVGGTFDSPTFRVDWKNMFNLPLPETGQELLKKLPLFN